MRRTVSVLAAVTVVLFAAGPALAFQCPKLIAQISNETGNRFDNASYDAKDKDFLERKDRYYYSVTPEDLKARLELVRNGFDVTYCLRKARQALDARSADGWAMLGQAYLGLNDVLRARQAAEKALAIDSSHLTGRSVLQVAQSAQTARGSP